MTAPNTGSGTPAPAAPAAPAAAPSTGAPGAAAAASAAPALPSRTAARASIMGSVEALVASTDQPATGTTAAGTTAAPAAASTSAAAPTNPAAPAAAEPAAQSTLEIHPETGPNPELGALKLRFKGADGQYTSAPSVPVDQKIELEVGGKTYVKDFAGIVRLAADGIANQRHAGENSQLKTRVIPALQQSAQQLQGELDAQIALNREILGDEGRYAARRQEYLQLNSPEQRAERAERALEERDRQATQTAQSAERVEFYRQNILPVLQTTLSDAPTISDEEALGRIAMQTSQWQVGGVIPPERFPELAAYLRDTFTPWAKGEHAKRSRAGAPPAPPLAPAAPPITDAQRAAQAATRDVAALVPAGTPGTGAAPSTVTPGSMPPARSRSEARDRVRSMITAGMS